VLKLQEMNSTKYKLPSTENTHCKLHEQLVWSLIPFDFLKKYGAKWMEYSQLTIRLHQTVTSFNLSTHPCRTDSTCE